MKTNFFAMAGLPCGVLKNLKKIEEKIPSPLLLGILADSSECLIFGNSEKLKEHILETNMTEVSVLGFFASNLTDYYFSRGKNVFGIILGEKVTGYMGEIMAQQIDAEIKKQEGYSVESFLSTLSDPITTVYIAKNNSTDMFVKSGEDNVFVGDFNGVKIITSSAAVKFLFLRNHGELIEPNHCSVIRFKGPRKTMISELNTVSTAA